jgi:Tfp pilus assembly protein PilX
VIKKICSYKKGYVLVYVIIAIVLATILSASLYTAAFLSNRLFMQQQNNKLAYYVAVSGVEYASYIIKSGHYSPPDVETSWPYTNFDPSGGDGSITSVTVSMTSSGTPTTYTITSNGQYSGLHKTITVTCSSSGSVITWQVS